MTNALLWEGFSSAWPSAGPGQVGGHFQTIPAWGLPLLNTLILLTSGVTVTIAHHALKAGHRKQLMVFLGLTVLLGCTFLFFQVEEYIHAYTELNLTLRSEEHTSELQSLMRLSYAVFCLKQKKQKN